ncbi:MAG TPA: SIS domain-containing protein, partial [Hyphomicrobiaceae bacterium]|nr:SIS domain-containing protein [Hyphomicrobiaceae bacterium]
LGAKQAGALTVAITNDPEAPLAKICNVALPIGAGPEYSVAATKTFVATAATLLRLTAAWAGDGALLSAICRLPRRLELASALDWSAAVEVLSRVPHLTSIGRGPTLAIAREAALKLKEICALHTDAFSAAEFQHGPIALVEPGYPVLMLVPEDAAALGMRQLARDLALKQAALLVADVTASNLPVLPPDQPETDALCLIQSFYAMMLALADRLDIDVDKPRNLQKITRTT